MTGRDAPPLTIVQRRRARRLAYWNGAVWGVGNGLASTTLVVYLAVELGAPRLGLGVGLILAMRHLVGLMQLGAPLAIGRLVARKPFCLAAFTLSALAMLALPWAAAPGRLGSAAASLEALVALWCLHHVMQYLGMVAFWSWLADLVPGRVRGRFLGRRSRWLMAGEAAGALAAGLHAWGFRTLQPELPAWTAYATAATVGALLVLASVAPVGRMPRAAAGRAASRGARLGDLLGPLADRRFLGLLVFGCWLSAANGVTQSAQSLYPIRVLGIGLFFFLAMQTAMRLGQMGLSPWLGRLADRFGNRPVMAASLLVAAGGPLCYAAASPERPGWFAGAWIMWTAYAGLNVCLPNLLLRLSPRKTDTPYIATYWAVTGLCYALSTIAGGRMLDAWHDRVLPLAGIGISLGFYRASFLAGWLSRSAAVVLLVLLVREPSPRAAGVERRAAPAGPTAAAAAR